MTDSFNLDGTISEDKLTPRDRAIAEAVRAINAERSASARRQMRKKLARVLGLDFRIQGNQSVGALRRIARAHFEENGTKLTRGQALAIKKGKPLL